MRKNWAPRLSGSGHGRKNITESSRAGLPAFSHGQDELRSIYQSITNGVVIFDDEGFIRTVNPAADAILGLAGANAAGTRGTGIAELDAIISRPELVPAGDMVHCREENACTRKECPAFASDDRHCWLKSGTICHDRIQGTFVHKRDACERCQVFRQNSTATITVPVGANHYEITVAPILNDDGAPAGRLAAFHDITVEHQRSTQLGLLYEIASNIAMSTDLGRSLDDSLNLCVQVTDAASGSIMLVEDNWLAIAVHRGLDPQVTEGHRQRVGEGISGRVAENGEPLLINRDNPAPDGLGTRDLKDAVCLPIRDEAGIVGVLSLNNKGFGGGFGKEDLDFLSPVAAQIGLALSRARLHEQITRQEQLKTTIVEGMSESLSVRGPDRTILFANAAHRAVFGDDCIGRRCHEVYMGRDRACTACPLDQCFRTGVTIRHSPLVLDCLGVRRHMEATVSPVMDEDGNVISCIETSRDVTELVQAKDQADNRLETLSTLFDISRTLSSSLELEHITDDLATHTLKALDASAVSIALADHLKGGHRRFVLQAKAGGADSWGLEKGSVVDAESLGGNAVTSTRGPLNIEDTSLRQTGSFPLAPPDSRSVLVGRLTSRKGLLGLITVSSTRQKAFADPALVDLFVDITNQAAVAIDNAAVYRQLEQTLWNTIRSLAEAIDAKDSYTRGHSDRVAEFAEMLAEELGLDDEAIGAVRYAGYLHDTGKIGVPDAVLNKAGRLTGEEYEIIMSHPVLSHRIIEPVDFLSDIKPLVRHHHERHDGTGYPDGLAGEEIPLGARIISVADAYEAMISDRPYRRAMTVKAATDELRRCAGSQFDPFLAEVFARLIETGLISGHEALAGD